MLRMHTEGRGMGGGVGKEGEGRKGTKRGGEGEREGGGRKGRRKRAEGGIEGGREEGWEGGTEGGRERGREGGGGRGEDASPGREGAPRVSSVSRAEEGQPRSPAARFSCLPPQRRHTTTSMNKWDDCCGQDSQAYTAV